MELSGSLLMDAETFAGQIGAGDVDYDTETIFFAVPANSQIGWTAERDGFIIGFACTVANNYGVSVNIDVPSLAVPVGFGVMRNIVWPPYNTAIVATGILQGGIGRFPFVAGDIINVRSITATALGLWLCVGYRRMP